MEFVQQIEVLEETSRASFTDAKVKVEEEIYAWVERNVQNSAKIKLKSIFVCQVKLLLLLLSSFKLSCSISLVYKGQMLKHNK